MEKNNLLRRGAANLTTGFRWKNFSYAFLLLAGLSGCDGRGCDDPKPKSKPIGWCGTGGGSFSGSVSGSACTIFATVEEDACHDGALGTKWLRLDNGDLLWPQSISMVTPTLEHGQRVQIGFNILQTAPTFKSQCQYFAKPEEPDLAIELTCLTTEAPANTETK